MRSADRVRRGALLPVARVARCARLGLVPPRHFSQSARKERFKTSVSFRFDLRRVPKQSSFRIIIFEPVHTSESFGARAGEVGAALERARGRLLLRLGMAVRGVTYDV